MLYLHRVVFAIAMGQFFISCSEKKNDNNRSPVSAPEYIGESFVVDEQQQSSLLGPSHNKKYAIAIREDSLEKEFLLQGEMITQAVVAQPENLKSRIVAFRKIDQSLFMLEATQGHSVTRDIPQTLVLAEFPITKVERGMIYFDFNAGMSKTFIKGDWTGQDFAGSQYESDSWNSLDLEVSFLEKALIDNHNNLVIHQVAQTKSQVRGVNYQTPIKVQYYLSPYKENVGFAKVISKDFKQVGFFEVSPQLRKKGQPLIYASKFDTRKQIVFAISDNTPQDFIQAVKEGVLYWNKAFGRNVLKVIMAPKGISAPDFHYNVIQWIDWEDAGYAYADAQMDPRTGEILHAQVFMTSVFAVSGKAKARRILKKIQEKKQSDTEEAKPRSKISLAGFVNSGLCRFEPSQHFVASLNTLLSHESITDQQILKASQDYIREVIAHEVGHTLGFRHNFAGSLAMNFPLSSREKVYQDYLAQGHTPPGILTSSSVMEYQRFEESTLSGDMIANKLEAFPYDQVAVDVLYHLQQPKEDAPTFCTDTHVSQYSDCQRFDTGASLIEYVQWQVKDSLENLPYMMMEAYIAAKSPGEGYPQKSLKLATPNPFSTALSVLFPRVNLLKAISDDIQFVKIHRQFGDVGFFNSPDLAQQQQVYVENEIAHHGGLSHLMATIGFSEIISAKKRFMQLLADPAYTHGIDANGQDYSFNPQEIELIKSEAESYFGSLYYAFKVMEVNILSRAKNIVQSDLGYELEYIMSQTAQYIILKKHASESESEVNPSENGSTKLPQFVFPLFLRVKAASLLKPKNDDGMWGLKVRALIKDQLKSMLDQAIGEDIAKVDLKSLKRETGNWVIDNRKVLAAL